MFDKEFKEALSNLPPKEKDKLVLRLLRKDFVLAQKLFFELVETKTVEEKRTEIESSVIKQVNILTNSFYSPGYMHMDLRMISGEISHHVKVTKDKFGEVSLNLLMLTEALTKNNLRLQTASYEKAYKCSIYIVARVFKLLVLIDKLHEDHFIDFQDDISSLGELISKNDHLMRTVILNGLDVNWLTKAEIPSNIAEIHKEVRAKGFLR